MKRFTKRVAAIAMALILIISMGTFVFATGSTTATMNGLTMQFGDTVTPPESNMRFYSNASGYAVAYENGIANYYPDTLAFYVTSGQGSITGMTGSGVTAVPVEIENGVQTISESWTTGFYILYINTATAGEKTLTISTESLGNGTLTFTVPTLTGSSGSKVYAYLPAPGQFVNEGITTGGWGDIYDASGNLKNNTATGVSLGAYGGYIVFDMDPIIRGDGGVYQSGGIYNSSDTPYGTDFIIFGNAFWNNAEPGLIQVSQNGTTWYDIANSKYYDSTVTNKNQTVTYTVPSDNHTEDIDYDLSQIESNHGSLKAVSYTGSVTGTVSTNPFHNHCWFPFNTNYFVPRTSTADEMTKIDTLPFVSRTLADDVTSTLTFTGLRLSSVTTGSNNNKYYQFGFADVHPNNTLGGTVSYNPYIEMNTLSDWNTVSANTSGGDPIDISWAVNPDGSPAKLDAIRFIRVYTSVAQMNGMSGEISTEVCGISVCSGTAVDSIPSPKVYVGTDNKTPANGNMTNVFNLGTNAVSVSISDYPSTAVIYMNGTKITGNSDSFYPTSSGTKVQIIIQNGDAAPYIGWVNLKSGW